MPHATMSSTIQEIPAEVLDALTLPDLDGLPDAKMRGAECLWCRKRLTAETAIDLGVQRAPIEDSSSISGLKWYPRACRGCVADWAHRGLFAHTPMCDLCETEETAASCIVGRSLYRLVRDCRR
ncbi:hypothetical protein [Streptomyces sp. NPDC001508]|uniref:hypothetical protein n=1 Tax=Streptomyces sp. NPDC001508 TaxID=3154656 RepID=UPI003330D23E